MASWQNYSWRGVGIAVRMVKLTDSSLDGVPVYLDADLVRAAVVLSGDANLPTAIYQQNSDTPIIVKESIEQVASVLRILN